MELTDDEITVMARHILNRVDREAFGATTEVPQQPQPSLTIDDLMATVEKLRAGPVVYYLATDNIPASGQNKDTGAWENSMFMYQDPDAERPDILMNSVYLPIFLDWAEGQAGVIFKPLDDNERERRLEKGKGRLLKEWASRPIEIDIKWQPTLRYR